MDGRFDVPAPNGTCYLANRPGAALRERLGKQAASGTLPASVLVGVEVSQVALDRSELADLSHPDAVHVTGLNREIHSTVDYACTQAWASHAHDSALGGIVYMPRHTTDPDDRAFPSSASTAPPGSPLLTSWGARLEAVNAALSFWAVGSSAFPWGADMSPDTLVLAMRAHARSGPEESGRIQVNLFLLDSRLHLSERVSYVATVRPDRTSIDRAPASENADAEVFATTADWKSCVVGADSPASLPALRVTGSLPAVETLLRATRLQQ